MMLVPNIAYAASPFDALMMLADSPKTAKKQKTNWPFRTSAVPLNLSESDDAYKVEVVVPGYSKQDIQIECKANLMHIKGKKTKTVTSDNNKCADNNPDGESDAGSCHEDQQKDTFRYIHKEQTQIGSFERTVELPGPIDSSCVSATLSDGVLTLILAKNKPATQTIAIN